MLAMAEPLVQGSGTEGLLPTSKLDIARLADANIADSSSDCISGMSYIYVLYIYINSNNMRHS